MGLKGGGDPRLPRSTVQSESDHDLPAHPAIPGTLCFCRVAPYYGEGEVKPAIYSYGLWGLLKSSTGLVTGDLPSHFQPPPLVRRSHTHTPASGWIAGVYLPRGLRTVRSGLSVALRPRRDLSKLASLRVLKKRPSVVSSISGQVSGDRAHCSCPLTCSLRLKRDPERV